MLRSILCDFSSIIILVKRTITVTNTAVQGQPNNSANKKLIFKSAVPFTNAKLQ